MTAHRPPTRTAPHPWARLALVVLALVAPLAACTGDGGSRSIGQVIEDAVAQAQERSQEETGDADAEPTPQESIGTDGRTEFDYAAYQRNVEMTFGLLQQFWAQELPRLGGTYSDPSAYTYYRSDQGEGPRCGDQQAPPRNAFYCSQGDVIAWDETGLLIPYYVGGGDFAASFVLAHEFGHAMQVRLPQQERTGVLRELQADCFAGAWARWTSEQGLLAAGDLDEATLAVFSARDLPGTSWTDPQAHGSGFERTRAFGDGFEAGAASCYPVQDGRWVVAAP